ncbi:MAG TPA: metalloregulator ArsR/SmtB family transcription factor [Phycisphaerales bacterium]|nr:metalloregulator ArsR/SmtB family transcription factor [Phycisphaerales bacterium]
MVTQMNKKTPRDPATAVRTEQPIDGLLDASVFKALSDPTRLKLLAALAKCARPCSVSEVAECAKVDLSVVSRHLSALEDAGLLASEKQGRVVKYHVRYTEAAGLFRALSDALTDCCAGGCGCGPDCSCGCGGCQPKK